MSQGNIAVGKISTKEAIDKTAADLADVLSQKGSLSPAELDLRLTQVKDNLDAMASHTHNIVTGPPKP